MTGSLRLLLALAALNLGAFADLCPQYTNCHDCLNERDPALNCGWCSPNPAARADGSNATQCMDHTSKGWACFHLYMHDGCVAGYICDHSTYKCKLAAPGEGDTKENCEEGCIKPPPSPPPTPPPPSYVCNISTFTCQKDPLGKTDKQGCSSACSNSTPAELVGVWRGLDVQSGFAMGEYVMDFTAKSVTWGPVSDPHKFAADVATLSQSLVRLTLTEPASLAGGLKYASYSTPGWPTGPETRALSIAIQREGSHQSPPRDPVNAMGDEDNFDVFVMNQCNSWKSDCSFVAAYAPPRAVPQSLSALSPADSDPCFTHTSCDTCIGDNLKVCGWCDGVITDVDGGTLCGADGQGCCGGAAGFSKCNVAYRKYCPVVCDWTNYTDPSCRAATSKEFKDKTQTYADCDTIAPWCKKPAFGHYCDRTDPANVHCVEVDSKDDCAKKPGCDPENPQCGNDCSTPPPKQYYYCDDDAGCQGPFDEKACAADPMCKSKKTTSCDPTACKPTVSYVCDIAQAKCKEVTGKPTPHSFNTSKECEDSCYDHDVAGVWRGLRIDSGYVADEWDFEFSQGNAGSAVKYHSKKDGKTYVGTYAIGAALASGDVGSFELVVTLSSGEKLSGLFSNRDQGPITRFMYLGLPLADGGETHDYDDAMKAKNQEFVLMACLPQIAGCDFNPAKPTLAELVI